ncbi:hypothetical protein, partial [Roseburia sp. 1XD42-69]|uniref:hypothetical protein n=1 Tax=Roseburia sp. 1XD42-69 TaxID=2320088 RepID=UPI000EE00AF6
MIFTTKNKEFAIFGNTITDVKEKWKEFKKELAKNNGKLFGENGALASLFSGKKSNILTPEILKQFDEFKEKFNSSSLSTEALAEQMENVDQRIIDYAKTCKNGEMTTEGFKASVEGMTLSAKAGKVALQALATVGNMFAGLAISVVISKVAETIDELVHSEENLRQSASNLGSELSNNSSDIEGYKQKIEGLKTVINDNSSSFDEVSQARVDLMTIQNELIEKFGAEKGAIENITTAINGQTDALDELSKRSYFKAKNEFNEKTGGDKFADWWTFGNTDDTRIQSNMDKMVDKMRHSFYELQTTGNDVLDNLIAKSYGLNIVDDMYGDGKHFQVYGTLEEIQDKLYGIQELSQDFELSTGFENDFTKISNDVDDALVKYKNLYDQHVLYEKILTDNPNNQYDEQFDLINKAKEAYNKAVNSGNEETLKTSANEYAKTLQSAIDQATNNYDYDVADYFKSMYPELQQMFGEWQFNLNFEPNTDGLQDKISSALDSIDGISDGITSFSVEDIENFNPNIATQEQINAYGELTNVAETYGLTVKQLIFLLETMGLIQSESYQQLVNTFGQENVNKLSSEDLEIAYTIENAGNMTFEQLQDEIRKTNETDILSFSDRFQSLWDSEAFSDTRKELQKLSKEAGIAEDDLYSLARENEELASLLTKSGISAQFAAACFNQVCNGADGFSAITEDALALDQVLHGMDESLQSAAASKSAYDKAMEQDDYNAEFENYQEAYKSAMEMFKNGDYGKHFRSTMEYLLGDKSYTMGIDEMYDAVKKLGNVFGEDATNGLEFLDKLYEKKDVL